VRVNVFHIISIGLLVLMFASKLFCQVSNVFDAKLKRGIDGDSFWLTLRVPAFDNSYNDYHDIDIHARMWRGDTPELTKSQIKGETKAQARDRRMIGYRAKEFTEHLLESKIFKFRYIDKYRNSRAVGEIIFDNGRTLKSYLKDAGYLTGKYEKY